MQAAGELAQFLEREIEFVAAPSSDAAPLAGSTQLSAGQPDRQRQRDEPLLRAVVEVPLELPALLVARLHETRA